MMKRRAGVVLVVTAVLAALMGPAAAGTVHNRYIGDPKRDLLGNKSYFTWKQKAAVDITRVHYWVTTHRFKIRFTVRNLRRDTRKPTVIFYANSESIEFVWEPGARPYVHRSGSGNYCRKHSDGRLNYSLDFVQISFPKGCFPKRYKLSSPFGETVMETVPPGSNMGVLMGDDTKHGRYIYI